MPICSNVLFVFCYKQKTIFDLIAKHQTLKFDNSLTKNKFIEKINDILEYDVLSHQKKI